MTGFQVEAIPNMVRFSFFSFLREKGGKSCYSSNILPKLCYSSYKYCTKSCYSSNTHPESTIVQCLEGEIRGHCPPLFLTKRLQQMWFRFFPYYCHTHSHYNISCWVHWRHWNHLRPSPSYKTPYTSLAVHLCIVHTTVKLLVRGEYNLILTFDF